jgi:hypothetical protein
VTHRRDTVVTYRRDTVVTLSRQPLIRLLAVNCAAGIGAALVMLGGLLALNPGNLRGLILADSAGGVALGLLLFGLVVTFGSVAMGSTIMMVGKERGRVDRGGTPQPVRARVR